MRTDGVNQARRGRPRPPATDESILRATVELLSEDGLEAATVDAIARRSGSAKTTIYRRWPSREALILDALRVSVRGTRQEVEAAHYDAVDESTVRGATRNIRSLVQNAVFRAAFPAISHELLTDSPLGRRFRAEVFVPIRTGVHQRLQAEVDRGAIRPDIDLDYVLDMANGAVLYRALVGEPVDQAVADEIADLILSGAAVKSVAGPALEPEPRRNRAVNATRARR